MELIAAGVVGLVSSYLGWRAIADGVSTIALEVRDADLPITEAAVAGIALLGSIAVVGVATWLLTAIGLPRLALALIGPGGALGAAAGFAAWTLQHAVLRPAPSPLVSEVARVLVAAAASGAARERPTEPRRPAARASADRPVRVSH